MPTIDFTVASSGITVYSDKYLKMPRFVPFDFAGKCQLCKSDAIDLDYVIQPHGCIIYCNRMKRERFVPFDYSTKLDDGCTFFRVKTRGRSMNIPYEKQTGGVVTLDNMDHQQSPEAAPVEREKQQLVLEVGSEEKQKKEGVEEEEIVFVENVKRAKTEGLLQTTTTAATITPTTTTIDKENEMAAEINFPSVPIVVIDDVEDKPKVQKTPSDVITQSEQMEVDKNISNDGKELGDGLKKSGEVEIITEQIVA